VLKVGICHFTGYFPRKNKGLMDTFPHVFDDILLSLSGVFLPLATVVAGIITDLKSLIHKLSRRIDLIFENRLPWR
jgi:hypothetical protein